MSHEIMQVTQNLHSLTKLFYRTEKEKNKTKKEKNKTKKTIFVPFFLESI